jgi:hypothetical protein
MGRNIGMHYDIIKISQTNDEQRNNNWFFDLLITTRAPREAMKTNADKGFEH